MPVRVFCDAMCESGPVVVVHSTGVYPSTMLLLSARFLGCSIRRAMIGLANITGELGGKNRNDYEGRRRQRQKGSTLTDKPDKGAGTP